MKEIFPFYSIGHFINQPKNATEFEITRFSEMEEPDVDDYHKHTFYEIIWIEKGQSRQTIDYRDYEVTSGSLFFISPGQLHEFEEWKPLTGGSIMFTEEFFLLNYVDKNKLFELTFLDNFYSNPVLRPDRKSFHDIQQTINQLSREKKRNDHSLSMIQALLHVLLLQIQRCINVQTNVQTSSKYIVIYKKFKNLVDAHFADGLGVDAYASKLSITQHHLNSVVKKVTGRTATQLIRARSILEAKRFLTFTDNSVSEIASHLGYFDSSYFAKLFKAEAGLTPQNFKASMSDSYRRR